MRRSYPKETVKRVCVRGMRNAAILCLFVAEKSKSEYSGV
jgi:hypothetical protein